MIPARDPYPSHEPRTLRLVERAPASRTARSRPPLALLAALSTVAVLAWAADGWPRLFLAILAAGLGAALLADSAMEMTGLGAGWLRPE